MIVVSTNDTKIESDGTFHRLARPDRISLDETTTLDVVKHALNSIDGYDAVCILQPTSPFRTGKDIANCVEMLQWRGVESVVSVTEGPSDLVFLRGHAGRLRGLKEVLIPNGAVFLVKTEVIYRGEDWYGPYTYGYVMPKERGLDINVQFDLDVARQYLPNMRVADDCETGEVHS